MHLLHKFCLLNIFLENSSQSTKDEAEAKNPSNSVEKYERELQELKVWKGLGGLSRLAV